MPNSGDMSFARGVPVATARPHNAELMAQLRAQYTTPRDQDDECGCLCRPPPSGGNSLRKESYHTAWRVGVCQIAVEAMLCFITIGYVYLLPSLGVWLLMSFFVSLVGVSSAICCCPSQQGWRTNFNLSIIAFVMRVIIGFVCFFMLTSNDSHSIAAVIYLTIIGLTLPIGIPFLCLSRGVSQSLRIHPFDPTLVEFQMEHEAIHMVHLSHGSMRTLQPFRGDDPSGHSGHSGSVRGSTRYPHAAAAAVVSYGNEFVPVQVEPSQIVVVTATPTGNTLTNSPITSSNSSGGGGNGNVSWLNGSIPIAKATGVSNFPHAYSTAGARSIAVAPQPVAVQPVAASSSSISGRSSSSGVSTQPAEGALVAPSVVAVTSASAPTVVYNGTGSRRLDLNNDCSNVNSGSGSGATAVVVPVDEDEV